MSRPAHQDAPIAAASPEQLAGELAAMMRTGVTIRACQQASGLLGLAVVRAKAATSAVNDLAVSAANLVREACASVDDISSGPSAVLLGIAPGFRSMPPKDRRAHVANEAVLSIDHIRKYREPQLLEAVADEIYAMDSAYRLRHRHRTESERSPRDSALKIDWLEQHRSYRRVWTPVTAMRNDVIVLAGLLTDAQAGGSCRGQQARSPSMAPTATPCSIATPGIQSQTAAPRSAGSLRSSA